MRRAAVHMIWNTDADTHCGVCVTYTVVNKQQALTSLLFVSSLALVSQPDMFE